MLSFLYFKVKYVKYLIFQFFIVCTLTVFFLRLILQVFKIWSQSYQGV
nr:MAG TPA: hypothetical protein [Caudoviricetes sp.]